MSLQTIEQEFVIGRGRTRGAEFIPASNAPPLLFRFFSHKMSKHPSVEGLLL